jgi:hypothetical protein
MNEKNIKPERITKPIQLLAVWLLGLIAIESSLLTASGAISKPEWLSVLYGISAVCIIPLFLILIFLLQTKYRPQIQEDEYYAKYLDKNTMQFIDKNPKQKYSSDIIIKQEINQLVKETQDNFANIKLTIDKGESKEKLSNLITISDAKIAELEKIVKFGSINLYINKTIDTFSEILKAIKNIGFSRYEEFGEEGIPQNFLVSFSKTIPPLIISVIKKTHHFYKSMFLLIADA